MRFAQMLSAMICLAALLASSVPSQLVHSGTYAAKVIWNDPGWVSGMDTGLDRQSTRVPVTGGNNFELAFWIRDAGDLGIGVQNIDVRIAQFDSGGAFVGDLNLTSFPHDTCPANWTEFTYTGTFAASAATVNMAFRPVWQGSSAFLIDDVALTDTTTSTALTITNAGFEDWPDPMAAPADWRHFAAGGAAGEIARVGTPSPGVNYASPFYHVITQAEMEAALGSALAGTGSPGLATLVNNNVFCAQDPSSSLGVVGAFWEIDYDADTDTLNAVTLIATEAEAVAGDASSDDSDLDLSGFAVSGETVWMLDNQTTPDQLVVFDLSGPTTAISGIALATQTGGFDSELAIFPTLGTIVFGDTANNAFAQYSVVTTTESQLISNATLAAGTGGTPDIDAQAGPKEIPGTTDFVWWDEDFGGGSGNLYRVDQAGTLTLLVDPAAFPGGTSPDPGIANLEATSDGAVFAFVSGFASSGNGILVREDDGTLHFFDDATLEAGFGVTVGDDDRGFATRETATGVDLFFGTDENAGDILVMHFPLASAPTAVDEFALYR